MKIQRIFALLIVSFPAFIGPVLVVFSLLFPHSFAPLTNDLKYFWIVIILVVMILFAILVAVIFFFLFTKEVFYPAIKNFWYSTWDDRDIDLVLGSIWISVVLIICSWVFYQL